MRLRSHLVILVVGALTPVLIFSIIMVMLFERQERRAVDRGLRETARVLAVAVDREVETHITTLEALATSEHLDILDLDEFHKQSLRVLPTQEAWQTIVLLDTAGRPVLDVTRPSRKRAEPLVDPRSFQDVVRSRRPVISDLIREAGSERPYIVVRAPVLRDGALKYVLSAQVDTRALDKVLTAQSLPSEWTGAILDREKVIIARTRASAEFIGRRATPGLAARSSEAFEGSFSDETQEGAPAYGAFSRVALSGWTVVLGLPAGPVRASLHRSLGTVVGGGLFFLAVGILLATMFGRRIARAIAALAGPAETLGRGDAVTTVVTSPLTEANEVGRALEHASGLLQERSLERERLLASAEAARAEAEAARERMAFLGEASAILATSLDYETTLDSLARLAIPRLADLCVIDVLAEDGTIRRMAAAYSDPAKEQLVRELREQFPPDPRGSHPVARVLRSGEPEIIAEIDETEMKAIASDPGHLRIARELGYYSYIVVPLVGRGRTLGTISLIATVSGHRYGAEDLVLAVGLARRAALAVDNARLFLESEGRRRVAEALAEVGHFLAQTLDPEVIGERIATSVLRLFGAFTSALFRLEPESGDLVAVAVAGDPGPTMRADVVYPQGTGVVGLAVRERRTVVTPDNLNDPRIVLTPELHARMAAAPFRAILATPLIVKDRVIGVLGIGDRVGRVFRNEEVRLAESFADQAALALENAMLYVDESRARAEAQAAERRSDFLAEASTVLASSLDYETTLASVARLAVPRLADLCAVDVVEVDGSLRRLAVAHVDPLKERLARDLRERYGFDPDGKAGAPKVVRTGQPEFLPDITDEILVKASRSPDQLRIFRELGVRSAIVVPLPARERVFGAITLIVTESDRRYSAVDLALAQDLGRRAALAVDNARLFAESEARRRAAEALTEMGRLLAQTLDLDALAQGIADSVCRLMDARMAVLYQLDAESGELRVLAASGESRVEETALPRGTGAASLAVERRHAVVTENAFEEAVLAVPLIARDRVIGALGVGHRPGRRFAAEEIRLGEAFADQSALALDNARLYREAQEVNRAKDEFLATLSHELRTPLTAMLGWSRMLQSGALDEAGRARALTVLDRNTRLQAQLIDDLLDVSRIITGKLMLDFRHVDLIAVIEAAIDAVSQTAEAKAIRLEKVLNPDVGPVLGDSDRLQQVVWNLLSNAIKFTPRGGRVEVRLDRTDEQAAIAVSDTGKGISSEFLPYIFDRFRQADSGITRAHGGLGIGLAIVRHLVALHKGSVHATSPGEDQGATFTVHLPLMAVRLRDEDFDGGRPMRARQAAAESTSLNDIRVLVVDDDADARELLTVALGRYGADVTAAASADEAMRVLERVHPHVLVSDISMPDADGYTLIARVRALGDSRGAIPAIALTAYARGEDRARALAAGFETHMAKPVEPAELSAVVARLARPRRSASSA